MYFVVHFTQASSNLLVVEIETSTVVDVHEAQKKIELVSNLSYYYSVNVVFNKPFSVEINV